MLSPPFSRPTRRPPAPVIQMEFVLIMINHPLVRGLSTRRLILLATVANLGIAGIVIGSSPQSIVPIFSAKC
jgi:hypothetical protein